MLSAAWCICDLPGAVARWHFPVPRLPEEHRCRGTSSTRPVLGTVDSRPVYATCWEGRKLDVDVSAWVSRSLWGLGWKVWRTLWTVSVHKNNIHIIADVYIVLILMIWLAGWIKCQFWLQWYSTVIIKTVLGNITEKVLVTVSKCILAVKLSFERFVIFKLGMLAGQHELVCLLCV